MLELKHSLGLTIVTVTHDMDSLWRIADRVALLANGRVAVEGTMEELAKSDTASRGSSSAAGADAPANTRRCKQ